MRLSERFSFGVNLDDPWRYAGVAEPKSIIFPHLLSLSLPEGRSLDRLEELEVKAHGDQEPETREARAALALADNLQSARVDFVRCWFCWSFFEPTPVDPAGVPSLLDAGYPVYPMDVLVDALTSKGIDVVPVVACGYQRMLPRGLSADSDPTLYIRRADIHARLLVRRYRGKVSHWQIENEPDWWEMHEAGGWRSGASWRSREFRDELLAVLNRAVHEEDPNALTIINLEADREIPEVGAFNECDILGLDFYPNYKVADPVEASFLGKAREISSNSGRPTFIAETGYPTGPAILGYTPSKQAAYVREALKGAFEEDSITGIGIWRYQDTAWKSFPAQENHFGLMDESGPKPGWIALTETIKDLRG